MAQNNLSGLAGESQRDSGSKPKVARHELPWVAVVRNFFNPNGVVAASWSTVPQPRWGWGNLIQLTQGSSFVATLGWRTQSRWDCRQRRNQNLVRREREAAESGQLVLTSALTCVLSPGERNSRSRVSVARLSCEQSRRTPHPNPLPSDPPASDFGATGGRGDRNMKNTFPAASADRELLKQSTNTTTERKTVWH
jgi:hypothetical protein